MGLVAAVWRRDFFVCSARQPSGIGERHLRTAGQEWQAVQVAQLAFAHGDVVVFFFFSVVFG